MSKYKLRMFYDWGSGTILWGANNETIRKFHNDCFINIGDLAISKSLKVEINILINWYQKAYDFDKDGSSAEWNYGFQDDFYIFTNKVYERLCDELGSDYEIEAEYKLEFNKL